MELPDMSPYKLFWGEMHDNTHQAPDPDFSMDNRLKSSAKHLDFYSGAYYPYSSPAFKKGSHPFSDKNQQPLNIETWKSPQQISSEWKESTDAIARHNREGEFITFPGFEWQGDGTWGDHNVFFRSDHPPLIRVETLEELYREMRGRRALAIPHHTAYIKGFRGKNWDILDQELSPFAEVFSIHGSSEGDLFGRGLRTNPFLGPDLYESSYSAAIKRGLKIGIIGSTDNWGPLPGHYGRGLAAVWAEELTRSSLWEAFKAGRVYGVSGDRIELFFHSHGACMGSTVTGVQGKRIFIVSAAGLDEIDYIDFVRDEVIVDRFSPLFNQMIDHRVREYQFRIEFGWGPAANVIDKPIKDWTGFVQISGGEITEVVPCWISDVHSYHTEGTFFRFNASTGQEAIDQPVQNGYVIRCRGNRDSSLEIWSCGVCLKVTLGELAEGSRIIWNRKESADLIKSAFHIDAEKLHRKDVLFGMAYKTKIYRAVPEESYRITCSFADEISDSGCHSYRVRVLQKNGQLAWSSPIWVQS